MFKLQDSDISTTITISLARKLKSDGVVDLLDPKAFVQLTETLSDPIAKLDLLWAVVKDQLNKNEPASINQETFESQLGENLKSAFISLEEDIENFIHALGAATLQRWSSCKNHATEILAKELETMNQVLDSQEVTEFLNRTKSSALSELGTE